MTELEYIEQKAVLEQKMRDLKSSNQAKIETAERRHRDAVQGELDRFGIEKSRLKTDYAEQRNALIEQITELQRQRAISRADEQKAYQQMLDNAAGIYSDSDDAEQPQS